jgi:hypothetical protein
MERLEALRAEVRAAEDAYYELRDAKSNGCCAGMNVLQVDAYDCKIIDAADKVRTTRARYDEARAEFARQ